MTRRNAQAEKNGGRRENLVVVAHFLRVLRAPSSSSTEMTFAGARVAKVGSVGGLAGPKRGARSCGARRVVTRAKVREIFMPALSSTMTEGKIVSWLKNSGDKISKGESIVVVESDKADMDVETFYDGFIGSIVVPDGATAAVGEPIAYIAESESDLAPEP